MSDVINVVEAKTHFAEWMNRVAYQGPVSYTHLDVYKRQVHVPPSR